MYFNSTTQQYERTSRTLITGFLHNLPLKTDDIETLLNVTPNNKYWGGSKGVTKKYIRAIGIKGMPALDNPVSFQVLNKALTPSAQQAENRHKNGFINTYSKLVTNLFGQINTYWVQLKKNLLIFFLLICERKL